MAEKRKLLPAVILIAALVTQGCGTIPNRTVTGAVIGGVVSGGVAYATSDDDGIMGRSGVTAVGVIVGVGIGALAGALFGVGEEIAKPQKATALPPIRDMP